MLSLSKPFFSSAPVEVLYSTTLPSPLFRSIMDNHSMPKTRQSCRLKMGLDEFVEMTFRNKRVVAKFICPCKNCGDESALVVKVAKDNLKSAGFTDGYAKIIGSKSKKSDENEMKDVEETMDIKSFKDFVGSLLPLGLKGRKLHDYIAKSLHLKHNDADKSISVLLEFTRQLSREVADTSKSHREMLPSLDEEEARKQNPASSSTSFDCEEVDMTTLGERSQASASTSSGSVAGYSPKEENRRKLREKINQRKESRAPRLR